MKITLANSSRPLKVMACVLCVGALPLIGFVSGCTTGNRYHQSTGEYIDDHVLSSDVKGALGRDGMYKYDGVNVVTFKGVVQLSGFVNTYDQKNRAGDIARSVPGVKGLENNITVKE